MGDRHSAAPDPGVAASEQSYARPAVEHGTNGQKTNDPYAVQHASGLLILDPL